MYMYEKRERRERGQGETHFECVCEGASEHIM